MPATSSLTPMGDPYVDGVLSGVKWAVNSFTFSFPTSAAYYGSSYGDGEPSNGFETFNSTQQTAVRQVLSGYAAVANITFTEITESSTQHAVLRFAESDLPQTGWA
jgi:serralysin